MRGANEEGGGGGFQHRHRIENKSFYDYRGHLGIHLQNRLYERDHRDRVGLQPSASYLYLTGPPDATHEPADAITTVLARNAVLPMKNSAVNALAWCNQAHLDIATFTHQAHCLLAGNDTGHIIQWNGQTLNWEPPSIPAHTEAIRDIQYSHDSRNLLTCGKGGAVKCVGMKQTVLLLLLLLSPVLHHCLCAGVRACVRVRRCAKHLNWCP